jgi:glycine cleavage system H lipoate-binding protein
METSGYVDMFATKGIEYVFILGFLLTLILFWKYLNRAGKPAYAKAVARSSAVALNPWFRLAEGLFYHQGHSWAMPEQKDVVRVGMDDFSQQLLGRLSSVDLPRIGARVEQGEKGWKLRVDSKAIDILSPVEGEVIAVNDKVLNDPHTVNQDPYENWLMKIRVPKMQSNMKNLLSGELAMAWMNETVDALRRRMAGEIGLSLQDGGVPSPGIARALSPDNWDEVAMEFLLSK